MDPPRILLALHAPGVALELPSELVARGLPVEVSYNQADTWALVRRQRPDAVLLVPITSSADAPELLSLVELARAPEGPALLVMTERPAVLEEHAEQVEDHLGPHESPDAVARRLRFAVTRRRAWRRIRREMDELLHLSSTDFKTGLVNDRQFTEACRMECARAAREERPVGVLVIDLDEFKTINDDHDHVFGDYVLRKVAEVLRGGLRPFDTAARMGGDEFAVLLPGSSVESARSIAERLRLAVAALELRQGGHATRASITIGAAAWDPKSDEPFEDTLRGADRALLAAKRAGRNRVAVYAGPVPDDLELEDEEGEALAAAGGGARADRPAEEATTEAEAEAEAEADASGITPTPRKRRGLRRTRNPK